MYNDTYMSSSLGLMFTGLVLVIKQTNNASAQVSKMSPIVFFLRNMQPKHRQPGSTETGISGLKASDGEWFFEVIWQFLRIPVDSKCKNITSLMGVIYLKQLVAAHPYRFSSDCSKQH